MLGTRVGGTLISGHGRSLITVCHLFLSFGQWTLTFSVHSHKSLWLWAGWLLYLHNYPMPWSQRGRAQYDETNKQVLTMGRCTRANCALSREGCAGYSNRNPSVTALQPSGLSAGYVGRCP
jgi:hypothetical protein